MQNIFFRGGVGMGFEKEENLDRMSVYHSAHTSSSKIK